MRKLPITAVTSGMNSAGGHTRDNIEEGNQDQDVDAPPSGEHARDAQISPTASGGSRNTSHPAPLLLTEIERGASLVDYIPKGMHATTITAIRHPCPVQNITRLILLPVPSSLGRTYRKCHTPHTHTPHTHTHTHTHTPYTHTHCTPSGGAIDSASNRTEPLRLTRPRPATSTVRRPRS
jgi:hypothetical protein